MLVTLFLFWPSCVRGWIDDCAIGALSLNLEHGMRPVSQECTIFK